MLLDGVHPTSWRDPKRLDIADIGNFKILIGGKFLPSRLLPATLLFKDPQRIFIYSMRKKSKKALSASKSKRAN